MIDLFDMRCPKHLPLDLKRLNPFCLIRKTKIRRHKIHKPQLTQLDQYAKMNQQFQNIEIAIKLKTTKVPISGCNKAAKPKVPELLKKEKPLL